MFDVDKHEVTEDEIDQWVRWFSSLGIDGKRDVARAALETAHAYLRQHEALSKIKLMMDHGRRNAAGSQVIR